MNQPSSPQDDPHSLVGWYVVDELDAEQRDEFEAHLPDCDNCTREVAEFRETTAELAALTVAGPAPTLRQSVLESIRTVRPLPPITVDPSGPDGSDETPTPADPVPDDLGTICRQLMSLPHAERGGPKTGLSAGSRYASSL